MSEEESLAMFDASLKKKKKKKAVASEPEPTKVESPQTPSTEQKVEEKKEQQSDSEKPKSEIKTEKNKEKPEADQHDDDDDEDDEDDDIDKENVDHDEKGDENEDGEDDDQNEDDEIERKLKDKPTWYGTDRDYTYGELAERIFSMLLENNPELAKSKRKPMKPPQVFREGTTKTVWANCQEMCDSMKRDSSHMLKFAKVELGTDISVDGNKRLVIKGRFNPKQIETVVRNYFLSYVACKTCKGADTILKKENRLYFVQCGSCGSIRSVESINKGFIAQVRRRKKEK